MKIIVFEEVCYEDDLYKDIIDQKFKESEKEQEMKDKEYLENLEEDVSLPDKDDDENELFYVVTICNDGFQFWFSSCGHYQHDQHDFKYLVETHGDAYKQYHQKEIPNYCQEFDDAFGK